MITNRNLTSLVIASGVMLAVTIALYSGRADRPGAFVPGTPLIQGLAPEKVHSIVIVKGKDTVTLTAYEKEAKKDKGQEKERGYQIAERNNYPASTSRINQLIINCMDIRCQEKVTDSKENHAALGVEEASPEAVIVRFKDADGKDLVGFVKGKNTEQGGGAYVRRLDQTTVYATESFPYMDAVSTGYLDKGLTQVKKEDVQRVEVQVGEERYIIARDEKGALALQSVPESKRPKGGALDIVTGSLVNLDYADVSPADKVALSWDAAYTCQLNSGLIYSVKLAKKDGKYYAQLSAKGPDITRVEISKTESDAELKKKEAILKAVDVAREFNPRHGPWVYEIQNWVAENMRKPLNDLIEDIPKAGDEVSASHLLVSYQGATRSEATRTKEEARRLADEALVKAKAPDADFAALAREYSDDASNKEKGGELGPFKKGVMDKAFEAAAFELKPGETSGVVETPFGFHIIKRTK